MQIWHGFCLIEGVKQHGMKPKDEPKGTKMSEKFTTYSEALAWVEEQSRGYKTRNHFFASDEYRLAYPRIKMLYEEYKARKKEDAKKEAGSAMVGSGIEYGDRVFYDVLGFAFSVERLDGVVVERGGLPYVKLDNGKRVRWHKGFIKKQHLQ